MALRNKKISEPNERPKTNIEIRIHRRTFSHHYQITTIQGKIRNTL